jgi:hypothetical protein
MKPVPFAQYLARQQRAASGPTEAKPWPPRARDAQTPERKSPLLRELAKPASDAGAPARRLEQAHLKAFEEGRAAGLKESEDEIIRLRERQKDEIAKARANWAESEAERLAAAHRVAIEDFEQRCAQTVAHILRPFLTQLAIARVTEALVESLEALFAARSPSLFEISGPADLLAALEEKFSAHKARIAFTPDESIDVRVHVEDTILESQLGPWLEALGALPRSGADE